jgi:dienelactone hydrolase
MKKHLCIVPLVLLASISLGLSADKSNFTYSVTFGPHPVGFRVVHQYDYSRVYKPAVDLEGKPIAGERARPIQTLIWYPAQPDTSARPMLYGKYLDLLATEEIFDADSAQRDATIKAAIAFYGVGEKFETERMQSTRALWEAKQASGKFPVVIYAPGLSNPAFENSDLCEYLASHGYVVVASPDMGARSRSMTRDIQGIQTQVADIGFLIGYLRNIPQADTSQIAVAGFSWGGISNVFAAVQDDRITALVCLDGTIRYGNDLLKEAKYVTPSRLTVPLLFLAQRAPSLEELAQEGIDASASFLNDIKYSNFHLVTFHGMSHGYFSSGAIRLIPDEMFTESTAFEVSESYSWMTRYILQFLNAYFKNDETARVYLKNSPEKNGVPRHLVAAQFRPALCPAPLVPDFARELEKQGFDKALLIWQEAKKKDAGFMLPEQEVDAYGYRLMRSGKLNEAIAVFKLNVAMYPEGYKTYDSLAEAQAAGGDKQSAIANYKRSLELNSDNTNAVERLKKLESNPQAEKKK